MRIAAWILTPCIASLACGSEDLNGPGQEVATVVVTPSAVTLVSLGETVQLTAGARNVDGDSIVGKAFTWSSSDEDVATVSSSGLVSAIANGGVTIAATTDGVSGTVSIIVEQAPRRLVFLEQPTATLLGTPISPAIRVVIQDLLGSPVSASAQAVALAITRDTRLDVPGRLLGSDSVSAVNGVAVFQELLVEQVGLGYTLVATSGTLAPDTSDPFDVGVELVSVSAGSRHTCGIISTGGAACWGVAPSLVPGDVKFVSLEAGGDWSCGVTAGGEGYCWGSNHFGQIGDGTTQDASEPSAVVGGLTFQTISVGGAHSCGLTTTGTAFCWGASGLLGNGTGLGSLIPVAVSGGLTFDTLDVGFAGGSGSSTCALTPIGTAHCWGPNWYGQLGDGTTTDRTAPVSVLGGLTFDAIAVATHACALGLDGEAFCWGFNREGQLGLGFPAGPDTCSGNPCSRTPRAVVGGLTFSSITVGRSHSCGVTPDGTGYCWGSNKDGVVGDGTTDDRSIPTQVSGALSFTSISAASDRTCGVTTDSIVYCWGSYWSKSGNLGTGDVYALVPTPVLGQQ